MRLMFYSRWSFTASFSVSSSFLQTFNIRTLLALGRLASVPLSDGWLLGQRPKTEQKSSVSDGNFEQNVQFGL